MLPRYDDSGKPAYGCSPQDTYADWQDPSPCIMKAGHWQYESNHDALTVNIWNALKYSFITYGELACFLMSNFFQTLGILDKDDVRLTAEGRLWFGKAERRLVSVIPKTCTIVYPSHPNTDLVIEQLLASVLPEYRKGVIPLGPLRRNRAGSAFLVPPLVIQGITEKLASSELKGVLLFDDALISGRTSIELKHVLLSAGATDVYTMVILDRRRLPDKVIDAATTIAYWRLDVPVIGNESTCPVCRALDKAKAFSREIVSREAGKRISSWQKEFRIASPVTDWTQCGLPPVAINLESNTKKYGVGTNDKVNLHRSTGLTAFVSELHTMTFRDDYALKVLDKEKKLNDPAKLELIAIQLILFNNEFATDVRQRLLFEMFHTLNRYSETDRHSSFASLTFFMQDKITVSRLVKALFNSGELSKMVSNADLLVALSYMLTLDDSLRSLDSAAVKGAAHLLSQGEDIASLLNCLHLETYSELGHAHARPIRKFMDEQFHSPVLQVTEVLNSIDQLKYVCDRLQLFSLRTLEGKESSVELLSHVRQSLSIAYDKIEPLKVDCSNDRITDARENVAALILELQELHGRLFFPLSVEFINSSGSGPFEQKELAYLLSGYSDEELQLLRTRTGKERFTFKEIIRVSASGCSFPDNKSDEVWVIWDAHVRELVKDLVANVVHAESPISDYWGDELGLAYMWIRVEYGKDYLTIQLANSSSLNAKMILQISKPKYEFLHLKDVGGSVIWKDGIAHEKQMLITEIHLPYAGKAGSLRGY